MVEPFRDHFTYNTKKPTTLTAYTELYVSKVLLWLKLTASMVYRVEQKTTVLPFFNTIFLLVPVLSLKLSRTSDVKSISIAKCWCRNCLLLHLFATHPWPHSIFSLCFLIFYPIKILGTSNRVAAFIKYFHGFRFAVHIIQFNFKAF